MDGVVNPKVIKELSSDCIVHLKTYGEIFGIITKWQQNNKVLSFTH